MYKFNTLFSQHFDCGIAGTINGDFMNLDAVLCWTGAYA